MGFKITEKVLDAFRAGDRAITNRLIESNYDKTKGFIYNMTKSEFIAEEITQETFSILWAKRFEIEGPDSFYAFLNAIARNLVLKYFNYLSTKNTLSLEPSFLVKDLSADIESEYIAQELELIIEKEISKMPAQRRTIFEMNKIKGIPVPEIAKLLNLSERTVENHIYRGMKELRERTKYLIVLLTCLCI